MPWLAVCLSEVLMAIVMSWKRSRCLAGMSTEHPGLSQAPESWLMTPVKSRLIFLCCPRVPSCVSALTSGL